MLPSSTARARVVGLAAAKMFVLRETVLKNYSADIPDVQCLVLIARKQTSVHPIADRHSVRLGPAWCYPQLCAFHLFGCQADATHGSSPIDHDKCIGEMLDFIDKLGIADDTFVQYSTDNGPHMNTWPDAGTTSFRNEKNSSWEGAYRIPLMVRFPGKIEAGSESNEIVSHLDWFPTILAIAGEPDIAEKLKKGHKAAGKTFKVHLDGYNLLPYLTGKEKESPRKGFLYFTDDGDVAALRYGNWKMLFLEQRVPGTLKIWQEPFVNLRCPYIFNLRIDPYERAQITSNTFYDWMFRRIFLLVPAQALVGEFLATFKQFPPRQKAASFSLDQVVEALTVNASGG